MEIRNSSELYDGIPNLKRAGINLEFSPEQVTEYLRCAEDCIYFIKKYIKIIHVDKGLINFIPYEYQERIIHTAINNRFSIIKLPRQAISIETPIITSNGFKKLKNIKVGEKIYGPDGQITTVIETTKNMYNRDCYEIIFDNKDSIIADKGHLWTVSSSNWNKCKKNEKILSTEELIPYISHSNKPYIKFTLPLNFEQKELLIDPYQFGVWLGDGNKRDSRITCHKDDLEEYKKYFDIDVSRIQYDKRNKNIRIFHLFKEKCKKSESPLAKLKVLHNKHIPNEYLFSSIEQRKELLKGLMDTDGSCGKKGKCEFYQKDEELIKQFRYLLSSLGIKSRKRWKKIKGIYYWTVAFSSDFMVFKLSRKAKRQKFFNHPKNKRLYIHKIQKTNSVPVKCIKVNNESELFLADKTLIPSHNSGKTTIIIGLIIWYAVFNPTYNIAILANKLKTAEGILGRVQLAYNNLPWWIQQGVLSWNKRDIELENGSKIYAAATSRSSIRSDAVNLVYIDEFCHVEPNMQSEFYRSTYPVITSGTTTKMIITSTPKGFDLFYKLWVDSEEGRNDFKRIDIHWSETPGRDEKWKAETIRQTSKEDFQQEFETDFLGSSATLISGSVLKRLAWFEPIRETDHFKVWEDPDPKRIYFMTVDTARGKDRDYSAFIVFDITETPYKIVAIYKNNEIPAIFFPEVIAQVGNRYNKAYLLPERNDLGDEVVNILHRDIEYENIIVTRSNGGRGGKKISGGFGDQITELGIWTTPATNGVGCAHIKTIIENNQMEINSYDVVYELSRYVQRKNGKGYEAESGYHDDLCTCLVLFAWAMSQPYIKDINNIDFRNKIIAERADMIDRDMVPAGFFVDNRVDFGESEDLPTNQNWWDETMPKDNPQISEYLAKEDT